jgi:uncharacterized protein (TIGR03790 family)
LIQAALLIPALASPAPAQDASNVLLVVNRSSEDSRTIGDHYARARGIPSEQIVSIATSTNDEITRKTYVEEIETPIGRWLNSHSAQDRILYIVLTKGVPLRITGSAGRTATTASVDSELTLLYRKLTGAAILLDGPVQNPYFVGNRDLTQARPFSHTTLDIYLVTRLDGYTVSDVVGMIDRAQKPVRDGLFLLDQRGALPDPGGDRLLRTTADRLSAAGFADRIVLESTPALLADRDHVLGYYSWGSNDPAHNRRRLGLTFEPGALVATFVSTDARTFKEPPETWTIRNWQNASTFFEGSPQSLVGDLIRDGATGAAGHVYEPYLDAVIRPEVLFPAYVAGFNLAEAYYLAMPFLSWQTVVIGDPLCTPFARTSLTVEQIAPAIDPETELPRYFSARRLQAVTTLGVSPEVGKLVLLGNTRLDRNDQNGARLALEDATKMAPRQLGSHLALATIYERLGEYDLAIDRYRTILKASPNEVFVLNNLAYALAVRKGTPEAALPLAEQAYRLTQGNSAPIDDTLGWIHHLLGRQIEAETFLKQAIARAPLDADIRLHWIEFLSETGHQADAAGELRSLLQTSPSLEDRAEVRQLRQVLGL